VRATFGNFGASAALHDDRQHKGNPMRHTVLATIVTGAVGLFAVQASAALSSADKAFVNEAAAGGLAEVQLG
jgi:hypothetical protein